MTAVGAQTEGRALQRVVIRPTRGWAGLNLAELWRYRELVYFLIWRDVKVRYKQTLLGAGWAILQPFLTMVVFSLFFGNLAKMPSEGIPYPIFSYAAILPWTLFESGVTKAGTSLVAGANLLTKVYFPRLAIPLAPIVAGVLDFALAFLVLLGMMAYFGVRPTAAIWTLPLFLLLALVTALGVSLWLAALNVAYRDIGYVIPFLMRVWFFVTPVVYSAQIVPGGYRLLYALNPMAGVVQGFRWAILGSGDVTSGSLGLSVVVAVLVLLSGALYFRRMERTFADIV